MKRSLRLLVCCALLFLAVELRPGSAQARSVASPSAGKANPCCGVGACTYCHGRGVCDDGACLCIGGTC